MTTPRTKERNLPHVNATVDRWQDDWIKKMARESGMNYSQVVRQIISHAQRTGYSPGGTTLSDLERETAMRAAPPQQSWKDFPRLDPAIFDKP